MCKIMCSNRLGKDKTKFFVPERSLLVDNGAMIAYLGEIMFKKKVKSIAKPETKEFEDLDIAPRQRTDDIKVSWR